MKAEEIRGILPEVFQRGGMEGTPLYALLKVTETLHQPVEELLSGYSDLLSPYRTPEQLVPFLAGWLDLERFFDRHWTPASEREPITTGTGRLRNLMSAAGDLSKWRGTAKGLRLFLELATGLTGFELEESSALATGPGLPFHLKVRAPQAAQAYRPLIERIVRQEKPIYMTHELSFAESPEKPHEP